VLRWFDPEQDTLTVRVPLINPSPEVATTGGYKCPCSTCPQCTADTCKASINTACCMDPTCADANLL